MNWDAYKSILKEQDLDSISILEKLGFTDLSPVELRRIFLLLTRSCFSTVDNYGEGDADELKKDPPLIYSNNKYDKKIDVDLDFNYDAEEVGSRPGVYVGLGDIDFQRQVVGDFAGISVDNSTRYFASHSKTTLHIRHISTSPDLCYSLANITAGFYLGATDFLESSLPGLGDFQLAKISKIQFVDPDNEKEFRVDVIFSMLFLFAWQNFLEGHRLKEITLKGFGMEASG